MRPKRTIRRESEVTVRVGSKHKPLVLIVPPTADFVIVRPKGHHHGVEVDIITLYHVASKLAARKRIEERRIKKARTR